MRKFLNNCLLFARRTLPQSCLLCGAGNGDALLCAACDADLPRLAKARCAVCAAPIPGAGVCGACLDRPPHFDRVTAVFAYRFPVNALVHGFKYGGNLTVGSMLAHALGAAVTEHVDLIIPMPLAPKRLRERGFNQARELARSVGCMTGIPVAADICRKVVETEHQASLPWNERAKNVRAAFVCDADLRHKKVAVIDDVMTSGATLNELAKILRRAGALEVSGWIVARALKQDSGFRTRCST